MAVELGAAPNRLKASHTASDCAKIEGICDDDAEFVGCLKPLRRRQVLDVACGTGTLALAAARAGAHVTGLDRAANLLDHARRRAAASHRRIRFDEGDVEHMPYADVAFDMVLSMFGITFAAHPDVAARELLRVCRPGGRIALACWPGAGFAGQLFHILAARVAPAAAPSPLLWGDETIVRERLSDGIADLRLTPRPITLRYALGTAAVVACMRQYDGPTSTAFAGLDEAGQAELQRELEALYAEHNRASDGTTHIEAEYRSVTAVRT